MVILFIIWFGISLYAQENREINLTIEDVFELAAHNSHALKSTQWEVERSQEAVKVAKSERLPSIEASLTGSYIANQHLFSRNFSEISYVSTPHFGNTATIDVSQPVYSGGLISATISLRELQAQLASFQHENNEQEIRFTLTDWYLLLCKLKNERNIFLNDKEQSVKLLNEMQIRHEQGIALKNDVTRYELRLKDIDMALERTNNQKSIINYQLATVLGLPDTIKISPEESFFKNEIQLFSEAEWQTMSDLQSYLILSAQKEQDVFTQQKEIVKAERRPTVYLWASENLRGPITTALPPVNQNLNTWQAGIGITYNLSSLYTTNKKLRMHEKAVQQSYEKVQIVTENKQMAIHAAYTQLMEAVTQLEIQKSYNELAVENYEVVLNRYLNGLAVITEMLDANNEQLSSEINLVNRRIDIYYHYFKLKQLTGIL